MAKIQTFTSPEVERLSKAYAAASSARRKATDDMRAAKEALDKLGFDPYGVSHRVRARLREARIEKSVARSRKRLGK